ncbi:hypothetical protein ACFQ1S_27010 [Kibdelosporangium lantanae]|uniref:Uncharacterized protein n=1 Tax=Kibdelosporangium lantanae TaxID=1497396 RepID=A0ABW3MIK7_9PSEU
MRLDELLERATDSVDVKTVYAEPYESACAFLLKDAEPERLIAAVVTK